MYVEETAHTRNDCTRSELLQMKTVKISLCAGAPSIDLNTALGETKTLYNTTPGLVDVLLTRKSFRREFVATAVPVKIMPYVIKVALQSKSGFH